MPDVRQKSSADFKNLVLRDRLAGKLSLTANTKQMQLAVHASPSTIMLDSFM